MITTIKKNLKNSFVYFLRIKKIKPRDHEKLLLATFLCFVICFYLFNITINGYADNYYSSAVQAATQSWHAFFFAGLDSAGYISIDKPPFSIWIMAIFTRLFGFSSFSMLLPNALAGVGTVYLVYKIVRQRFSMASAFISSFVMAFTPVAVLMYRYNHPDSILVLLLTASVYCFIQSLNKHSLTWLLFVGLLLGLAFNTKMIQALIILPVLIFVYIFASNYNKFKKALHVSLLCLTTAIAALWWPIVVYLTPAANRPYIGSTTDNNIWSLVFGFNGLSRLASFDDFSSQTMNGYGGNIGLLRMFNSDFGPNVAWFLPLALISLFAFLWFYGRKQQSNKKLFLIATIGGWLVSHIIVFSFFVKIIHPYYSIAFLPPLAMLVGIGLPILWQLYNQNVKFRFYLPIAIFLCGVTDLIILSYDKYWLPNLRWFVFATITVLCLCLSVRSLLHKTLYKKAILVVSCALIFFEMFIYSISGMLVSHTGSISIPSPILIVVQKDRVLDDNSNLKKYLIEHKGSAKWIAATTSVSDSSPIQIATDQPVMALGGFIGKDETITLSQFKSYVAKGYVRYFAVSLSGSFGGSDSDLSQIVSWATHSGQRVDYGGFEGYELYDLSNIDD